MAHLLDHDHRGFLVQNLIDRRHAAELHQRLDDLGGLDRHLVRKFAYRDRFRHGNLAHDRFRRLRKPGLLCRRCRRSVSGAAARMPAAHPSARVAASFDHAPSHGIVTQNGRRLYLLRLPLSLAFLALGFGRMQRALRGRGRGARHGSLLQRRLRLAFGLLLLRLALLSFLLVSQFLRLDLGQLPLTACFVLAQLDFLGVQRGGCRCCWGRSRRRRRRPLLPALGGRLGRIALHEHPLLAHLHLDRARLAHGVGFLDLARLLAREGDLVLRLRGSVRFAQILQKPGLVLLRQRVLGDAFLHARGAQLLEQDRWRYFKLAGELCDAGLSHVTGPPCALPDPWRLRPRTSAHVLP